MRAARNIRGLQPWEVAEAAKVFQSTIIFDRVAITDGLGYNDREFTLQGDPLTINRLGRRIVSILFGGVAALRYSADPVVYMNLGPDGYRSVLIHPLTFIHEMTHVWQYMHGSPVVFDSLLNQAIMGDKAYEYVGGSRLADYNVEQQAHIVEDWYRGGMNPNDKLFPYVRDFIRTGKLGRPDPIRQIFTLKF